MSNTLSSSNLKLPHTFDSFIRNSFLFGSVMLFLSLILYFTDKHHFFFSYLNSYVFFFTLTLGAMFLVLIQYVTSTGWSVVVRRVPEVLMNNIMVIIVLFIPILFGMHDLYHWTHIEEVLHDHILAIKQPYLNVPFFVIRFILYFALWRWISKTFFSSSINQDQTGQHSLTMDLERKSTYSLIFLSLTFTFASIDLIMSLTPHWYSTIFGIYIFAGAILVALCVTSLIYLILRKKGILDKIVTVEHFHDLGKLIYGFNIFWSYIAFCQFFLIWYANVPEETIFYAKHTFGSWNTVSIFLIVGHFAVPFILFMSRNVKRNLTLHAVMVSWIIFMHIVDIFWIIMPTATPDGISLQFVDITLFLGMAGVYFSLIFKSLRKVYLIPRKDPRLSESLNFTNI